MNTDVFLSIRAKSTRLPNKALLEIQSKTVTEHLIDRLKQARRPRQIVMCTSTNPGDDVLVALALRAGVYYFRGHEDDKLDRYLQASQIYGTTHAIIVDGDDIFCDPEYIDRVIERIHAKDTDYVTTYGLPLGCAAYAVKVKALERVCAMKGETDTEVWGGYFTATGRFKVDQVEVDDPELWRPDVRMTLDYWEDFEFFKEIFEALYVPGRVFSLREVMRLLQRKPEIIEINRGAQARYEANLLKAAPVRWADEQIIA
jgi:spore coat polysaccharide biosynthesis protein SpsF